ncbi:hypothetical protein RD792_008168 [Penstemon davidsonii]|uniref:ATPase AAA-type core domain-containing protein n=1 Tax=Penstemon davidsonii TaxID=160366 RepID=A0ABR0D9C0_9LAMI|nr:hypothetical protein RD792_008168 [Penstemon davidsonii]
MLAYANPADALDEPFHIGESTACETLRQFCKTILKKYKKTYLREPNVEDIERLLAKAESRGFPGMIGSLDCMHWEWKNCPTGWQGAFSGRLKKPTIILEAVADADTWIWHAFFGVPGSQNDITVLGRSPLFDSMIKGTSPHVNYEVNNKNYFMTYYLADGIYPKWATLIQAIRNPIDPKEQFFTQMQESYRKDVERAFGILQARFAIIKMPGRGWNIEDLSDIMLTCIVLHNMIVEDERDEYGDEDSSDDETDPRRSRRARAKYYEQSKKKTTTTVELSTRSGEIDIESYMMRRGNLPTAKRIVVANCDLSQKIPRSEIWNNKNPDFHARVPDIGKDMANAFSVNFLLPGDPMVVPSETKSLALPGLGNGFIKDRMVSSAVKARVAKYVLIDELDAIAPARKDGGDGLSQRMVATLLTLMDGISSTDGIVIIAATNQPDSIDPALRRCGRLERVIEIGTNLCRMTVFFVVCTE